MALIYNKFSFLRNIKKDSWSFLFFLFAGLLIHIFTLLRYPAPFVDEAWLAARAWSLIHSGKNFGVLDFGVLSQFHNYWYFYPLIPTLIQSIGFFVTNTVSLISIRVVSQVFGFLLLLPVYIIGSRAGGKTVGRLSVIFLILMGSFFASSHLGRMDIFTAFFGYSAIAVYLSSNKNSKWRALIGGLLIGLAFEIHPYGILFAPVLLVLIFINHGWTGLKRWDLLLSGAGLAAGLLLYMLLHVIPSYSTYRALNNIVFTTTHTPPLLTFNFTVIKDSFIDTFISYMAYDPILIALTLVAHIDLFSKKTKETKIPPLILLVLTYGNILLARNKLWYYTIIYSPIGIVYLTNLLVQFYRRSTISKLDKVLRPALLVLVLVGNTSLNLWTRNILNWTNYNPTAAFENNNRTINKFIKDGDIIFGPQTYWFGFSDHRYYSWQNIIYYRQWKPQSSVEDAIHFLKPDIIILDSYLRSFIRDSKADWTYIEFLRIPRTEFEQFLNRYGEKLINYQDPYAGNMEVYRIHWDNTP